MVASHALGRAVNGKGRLLASVAIDAEVGAVSYLTLALLMQLASGVPYLWLGCASLFTFGVLWLIPIVYLARRGQTIGLHAARLGWRDDTGRCMGRRVLGDPQFWCAAGPAILTLLFAPLVLLSRIVPLPDPQVVFGGVVACALATLALSRRYRAQLIPRPS